MKGDLDVVLPKVKGATYRQLDYWVRKGYLRPQHTVPAGNTGPYRGTGYAREWPDSEIRVAEKMARLVAVGFPPALAAEVARGATVLGRGIRVEVL